MNCPRCKTPIVSTFGRGVAFTLGNHLRMSPDCGYADWSDEQIGEYLLLDGGAVLCSRYGRSTAELVPIVVACLRIVEGATGEPVTVDSLDDMMGLAVNDHDDLEWLIRERDGEFGLSVDDFGLEV